MSMPDKSSFVVAANRLPVRWNEEAEEWRSSPGGLVTALKPILQERDGTWVGWTGQPDLAPDPFEHEGILQRPVTLSSKEISDYYHGFCNATIWPLYHNAIRTPEYHRHWWRPYESVNRRFADAIVDVLDPDGAVWIHDYHLQLVPGLVRAAMPDARVGFFLHIPFPPLELFSYIPWRREILRGLLGADVVAFQTRESVENFAEAAERFVRASTTEDGLVVDGGFVRLQVAPISVDTGAFARIAAAPETEAHAASIRERMGGRRILLGVDRLDYTKGIANRLKAIETFFERFPETAYDCAVLQIAVPTRQAVADYVEMRGRVERLVGRINGRFGRPGFTPITYSYRSLPAEELIACYRAADVMMVTPFRDGMNLVAKEYVASRVEDSGVLVLSEFAGAADELEDALLVNPNDVDWLASTLDRAARLPAEEQRRRMASLRARVAESDVFAWSRRCLEPLDVAALRPA
jgi:trehalose 6-phosphate synthase